MRKYVNPRSFIEQGPALSVKGRLAGRCFWSNFGYNRGTQGTIARRRRETKARPTRGKIREDGAVAKDAPAEADTFPKLLIHNARVRGDRAAVRHKDLGIWQSWTWEEVLD